MWISPVRLAYEAVWNGFVTACEQTGCIVKPRLFTEAVRCENPVAAGDPHQVHSLLYLRDLPFRSTDTSKKVEVLIKSQEFLSGDWRNTESSRVKVVYLDPERDCAQLLQSVRYDFEGKVQTAHPWFHAQLSVDCLDATERRRLRCTHAIHRDFCRPVKSLRIATAHMGLTAVLLGLAADHLNKLTFEDLVKRLRGEVENLPPPRFPAMQRRLQRSRNHFMNINWFEEAN